MTLCPCGTRFNREATGIYGCPDCGGDAVASAAKRQARNHKGANMSYDIELIDPVTKEPVELDEPHHMRGGTYAMGGTTRAHLNVTYNYGGIFYRVLGDEGIRTIYGMSGADSISLLEGAAAQLADDVDPDYWKATDGNAKRALVQLAALAKMRPDAVWAGD